MVDEFDNILQWANNNKMIINRSKTKEIVFHRPSPTRYHFLPSIPGIALVDNMKSLGVILQSGLTFELHVDALLKQCSQRIYLLRMLRYQGLSADDLNTIFVALVISRILYALPAWGVFVSNGIAGRVDAFLKRAYKYGFSKDLVTFDQLLFQSTSKLFSKIRDPNHCLHSLAPVPKVTSYHLRNTQYCLPQCNFNVFKNSFINWCLFHL
jgi:hypothetical protein